MVCEMFGNSLFSFCHMTRAPMWANYLRITLDYSLMSNGTWYIDDFSVHLW